MNPQFLDEQEFDDSAKSLFKRHPGEFYGILTFYEFINNSLDSKNGFVLDSPQFKGPRVLFIPEF
jgi:hypothetical protein